MRDYTLPPIRRTYHIPLSERAFRAIGHLIVQWGALDLAVQGEIHWIRPALPEPDRSEAIRDTFRSRIAFLRRWAPTAFAHEKPHVLPRYIWLLDRTTGPRGIRDKFAHGTFELMSNQNPDLVTVNYKGGKHRYSTATLESTALEIGTITTEFLGFRSWAGAEMHDALRERFLEQQRAEAARLNDPTLLERIPPPLPWPR